jgi:hypothetical protein
MSLSRTACAALVLSITATAAQARDPDRIFSYDPVSESADTLAHGGLTFVFRKQLFGGTRVLKVLSTQEKGTALLKPAGEKELGAGLAALVGHKVDERDLYEILPEDQGAPLIRAACPGSTRAWLAFGDLKIGRNLVIHAFGAPETGKAHLCASMEFAWHGEWKLPAN